MYFFDYSSRFINIILIGSFIGILVYFYFNNKYKYWGKKRVPYVRPPSFIFGNAKDMVLEKACSAILYDKIYREFKGEPYCGLYEFHYPVLIIRDPELIQQVLVEKFNSFHDNKFCQGVNPKADEIFSLNPFVLKGNKWNETRSVIVSGLTPNKLRGLEDITKHIHQNLTNFLESNRKTDIETLELASNAASELVAKFGWGIQINGFSEESPVKKMFDSLHFSNSFSAMLLLLHPFLGYWLRAKIFDKDMSEFIKNITEQCINQFENNAGNQNRLLQTILIAREKLRQNGKDLSVTEISAHLSTFYLNGYDTFSRTLSYILYCLMLHQKIQQKLREEINSVDEKNVSVDLICKLRYLDMVISEVGRMYPPVAHLGRICTEKCKLGDLEVDVGTRITIPSYSIHHDPEYYPNPETFNPENFSEESRSKRHKFTYFLFGQGPRICPGLRYATASLKLFLYHLLKDYEILPPMDHPADPIKCNPRSPFIYVSKEKLYVTFKKMK